MKAWKMYGSGILALAGFATGLQAQETPPMIPPTVGGVTTVAARAPDTLTAAQPGIGGAGVPTTTAAPPVTTIWQKLGVSKDQLAVCKMKCCATPIGQLVNSASKVLSTATGGLIPPHCPVVPPTKALADEEKKKPGGVGAAAEIKESEAQAKERRAAIRYLGTVDCERWPSAKAALLLALKEDKNECVRWEAAMALGNGCCCNKDTIKSLRVTVEGSKDDGREVAENSDRVKAAAWDSLQHCLVCYQEPAIKEGEMPDVKPGEKPEELKKPEKSGSPTTTAKVELTPALLRKKEEKQLADEVDAARRALAETPLVITPRRMVQPSGQRTVFHIVKNAVIGHPAEDRVTVTPMVTTSVVREEVRIVPQPTALQTSPPPTLQVVPPLSLPTAKPVLPQTAPVAAPMQKPITTGSFLPVEKPRVVGPEASMSRPPSGLQPASLQPTTMAPPAPMPTNTQPSKSVYKVTVDQRANPASRPMPRQQEASNWQQPRINVGQMQKILAESAYPFQREWAARNLANSDPHGAAEVVPALLKAATQDSSTGVRVECIRGLVKMNANSTQVRTALQTLKGDYDPLVRLEANKALGQIETAGGLSAAR